ncbi:M23 family metallopeptidase [Pelagibaculum spongiae]|nr:M23 family metallopeptidase [Pelagibaculum spongiae]
MFNSQRPNIKKLNFSASFVTFYCLLVLFAIVFSGGSSAMTPINHSKSNSNINSTSRYPSPKFQLPISCQLGESCFVQQYVDVDPSVKHHDYQCNQASYDNHKGTDFRLLSIRQVSQNFPVIAASDGLIKAARDGATDKLVTTQQEVKQLSGKECGNGVVIKHDNGWETQYCHLRKGSIQVSQGNQVKTGDLLGYVGHSGKAAFPHLHFSVRHFDQVIDPFTGLAVNNKNYQTQIDRCNSPVKKNKSLKNSLWHSSAQKQLVQPKANSDAKILALGFSINTMGLSDLTSHGLPNFKSIKNMPAVVLYSWIINLQQQDRIRLTIFSPTGTLIDVPGKALQRNKAQYSWYIGKRMPEAGWQKGTYTGRLQVIRNGKVIRSKKVRFEM